MILTNPTFALDSCCFKIYHIYKSQISLCWPQYCIHRTLQPGDEILDNYGYHYAVMPKEERQRKLYNQYYFTCACQSCNSNWPVYSSLSQVSKSRKYPEKLPVTIARGFCLLAAWLWLSVGLSYWCQLPLAKPDHNEIKRSPAKKNTPPTLAGCSTIGRDSSRASQADCVGTSQSSQAVQEGFRLCPHRKTQVKLEEKKSL